MSDFAIPTRTFFDRNNYPVSHYVGVLIEGSLQEVPTSFQVVGGTYPKRCFMLPESSTRSSVTRFVKEPEPDK
jgi:hypothetical protein